MVRSAPFLGPLQGEQPTLPAPARRTRRVPAQPRALALASDRRSSLAVHLLAPGRLLAADAPSTSPYTANALLPMSVTQNPQCALSPGIPRPSSVALGGSVKRVKRERDLSRSDWAVQVLRGQIIFYPY